MAREEGKMDLTRLLANPLGTYFALASSALLIASAGLFHSRIRLARGERANGEVIELRGRMLSRPSARRHYMPVVRFQPRHGSPVEFQSRFGGTDPVFSIGEIVPVRYLLDNPEKAEIATPVRLWLAPLVLLGMALVMLYAFWKAGSS